MVYIPVCFLTSELIGFGQMKTVSWKIRVGIISSLVDLLQYYKLQIMTFGIVTASIEWKNSELFRIIDYKLVQDFSQNRTYSKLVKIPQKY
jgi:hypothetical protein